MSGKRPRYLCSDCRRYYRSTNQGMMRTHRRWTAVCPGAGKPVDKTRIHAGDLLLAESTEFADEIATALLSPPPAAAGSYLSQWTDTGVREWHEPWEPDFPLPVANPDDDSLKPNWNPTRLPIRLTEPHERRTDDEEKNDQEVARRPTQRQEGSEEGHQEEGGCQEEDDAAAGAHRG